MGNRTSLKRTRTRLALLACLAIAALAGGCGDDDSSTGDASTSELLKQLVPAEEVKFEVEREFEWDNPTDFVAQGVFYSEQTAPSELIGEIDDAGFTAAAGQHLKDGEVFGFSGAATFGSEEGAETALETLHAEDLKQPCFSQCTVSPAEYTVEGIPNSLAVHHVPNEGKPPPGHFAFESYLVEFTVGSELHVFQVSGPPGLSEADFDRNAKAVYEHATAQD